MNVLLVKIAWRNIVYYSKKSIFSLLAIACCYAALNIFQGYIHGAEVIFRDSYAKRTMFGDLLIKRTGTAHLMNIDESSLLTKEEQSFIDQYLKNSSQVNNWVRFLRINGSINNGETNAILSGYGYDISAGEKMRAPIWTWNTTAGHPLAKDTDKKVLLGTELGKLVNCNPLSKENFISGQGGYSAIERPFHCQSPKLQITVNTFSGQANATEVEVAGLVDAMFREVDMRFVYLPLNVVQNLQDTDKISFYSVKLTDENALSPFSKAFEAQALAQGFNLSAISWKIDPLGNFYASTMNFLHTFQIFIIIVILGVALLSIFNTFMRNVQERTREIGVLKTVGFRASQVKKIFFLETFFLTCLGAFVGGAFAILIAFIVHEINILYKVGLLTQPVPFLISISLPEMFLSFFLMLAVALFAVSIPLRLTNKRKITENLSYV